MYSQTLYIAVDHPDKENEKQLIKKYEERIQAWNKNTKERYADSGFDLLVPSNIYVNPESNNEASFTKPITINHHVKVACYTSLTKEPRPYYLYPRSSISKTPYRMANSVGIIDSGYRGNIIAKVDDIRRWSGIKMDMKKDECIQEGTRLFQLCSHNLLPFEHIKLVSKTNVIMDPDVSKRGEGGFGSTDVINDMFSTSSLSELSTLR